MRSLQIFAPTSDRPVRTETATVVDPASNGCEALVCRRSRGSSGKVAPALGGAVHAEGAGVAAPSADRDEPAVRLIATVTPTYCRSVRFPETAAVRLSRRDRGEPLVVGWRCVGNISNTVTGLDIILDNKWNYRVAHTADISIKLYPVRKVYGGSSHNQRLDNVWVRQK